MHIKGIFHIHSAYSYDSEFSLSRIREALIKRGCDFGVICDHHQDFDEERYAGFYRECAHLSDDGFSLIPGLEFEFGQGHILGIGLRNCFKPEDIGDCLKKIKSQGGLAVWAHPGREDPGVIRRYLKNLDGIEVWSARYGSKYAPSIGLCDFVRNERKNKKGDKLWAYAGQDAHREDQFKNLYLELEVPELKEQEILQKFKTGDFRMCFHRFSVPADATCLWWQRAIFPVIFKGYRCLENLIDRVNPD